MTAWTLQILSSQGKLDQCNDMDINVKLLRDGQQDHSNDWTTLMVEKDDTIKWQWKDGGNSALVGLVRKSKPNSAEQYSRVTTGNTGGSPPCGLMEGHDDWQYVAAVGGTVQVTVTYDIGGQTDQVVMDYIMVFTTTHGHTTYDWYHDPEVCLDPVGG